MERKEIMPILFVGHGTPMNAVEENEFSSAWKKLGRELPLPKAILCVSAHWMADGSSVTAMEHPETIHDFGGFPHKLYEQQYPAPGSPELAEKIRSSLKDFNIAKDYDWGLDHGAWSVLRHMYPEAGIPVVQLCIDYTKDMSYHYDLGRALSFLRERGILIIGSGNMVHNLMMARWKGSEIDNGFAYDWATELNEKIKEAIVRGDHQELIDYESISEHARQGIPTEDHYIPLIYMLGLQADGDAVTFFNDKVVGGSISMTSMIFGNYTNIVSSSLRSNSSSFARISASSAVIVDVVAM